MKTSTKTLLIAIPAILILPISIYALWLWLTAPGFENVTLNSEDFKVETVFYGHESSPERTIIIVPPTGGINLLDKLYAHSLWKAGCDVYILTDWTGYGEIAYDLQVHQRFYSSSRKAIGMIIDRIKSPFIGLLGTSVGGLHTGVALGTHDRISSALVITGGSPITEVVVNSNQGAMRLLRDERYKMYHFKDDTDYLNHLNEALTIDHFDLPKLFEGKRMGVIISDNDLTVPTANQYKMKEYLNAEILATDTSDHFYTIVKTGLFRRGLVVDFFTSSKTPQ